ncbi:hypothetical protein SLEP1_g16035 [Rubroshorea leprosula]|uniref:Uncharacterized protein n=1 Tax=Rubroshorea leprosula TaxID=152421 RepID=A0AAV5J053_9ROSI|nr:hypothetical protein SLEP1_g16035 [Rubroshorea leprosula]
MPPRVLIIIGLVLGYNICPPMKKFESSENFQRVSVFLIALLILVLNSAQGNPSKSAIMAPVARDIVEMGVDPIVRGDLRNFSYYYQGHDNFSFCCCQFFPFLPLLVQKEESHDFSFSGGGSYDFFSQACLLNKRESSWSSNAFNNTASKNNTTFIASILLSLAPSSPPPIPTTEIVKGGKTGNAARNVTIASMRRKPRSVNVRGLAQGFRAGIDRREQRKLAAKNSKDWAAFKDAEDSVIAIHIWSSFVNAEVLKVYDVGSHCLFVFRNSLVFWIPVACMLRLILFRYEGRAKHILHSFCQGIYVHPKLARRLLLGCLCTPKLTYSFHLPVYLLLGPVHLVIEFLCLELFGLCGLLPKVSQEKEFDSSFDVVECDYNKASSNMEEMMVGLSRSLSLRSFPESCWKLLA